MKKFKYIYINQEGLSEINQASRTYFSLLEEVSGVYHNYIPIIKCRDYFSDMCYSQFGGDAFDCHGFYSSPSNQLRSQLDAGKFTMLFVHKEDSAFNIKAINDLEKLLGFGQTTIEPIECMNEQMYSESVNPMYGISPVFHLLTVDAQWFSNSLMITFYTQLLRLQHYGYCLFEHVNFSVDDLSHDDAKWVVLFKENKDKLLRLLRNHVQVAEGAFVPQPYAVEASSEYEDYVHEYSGIKTFLDIIIGNDYVDEGVLEDWVVNFNNLSKDIAA